MDSLFKLKTDSRYNLRKIFEVFRPIFKTAYKGTESISYLGPKIWDILQKKLRNMDNLENFKKEIKTWKPIIVHVGCGRFILKAHDLSKNY